MPNQYTKFRESSKNLPTREFKWREYPADDLNNKAAKTQSKQRNAKSSRVKVAKNVSKPSGTNDVEEEQKSKVQSLVQRLPGNGYRISPFDVYPVKANGAELQVIDYFLHILTPSSPRYLALQNPSRKVITREVDPHLNLFLPHVLQQPVLFDALLASCQASLLLSKGMPAYGDRFFLMHRVRAMEGLRDKLNSECYNDDESIMSITMLLITEYMTGNTRGVVAHWQGLEHMISTRGGLPTTTRWDRFMKGGVEAFKSIGYFSSGQRGIGNVVRNDLLDNTVDFLVPLEYYDDPNDLQTLLSIPSGFVELALNGQLSTQLIAIITILQTFHDDPSIVTSRHTLDPLNQTHALQAALQRFVQHPQATHLELCIAAGLLSYSMQYPRLCALNMFHDPPLQGFIKILSRPHRPASSAEKKVFMWIAMSVEGIQAMRSCRLPGSSEIFSQALLQHPPMREWSTLEENARSFFYSDDLLIYWRMCWQRPTKGMVWPKYSSTAASTASELTSEASPDTSHVHTPLDMPELPDWHPKPAGGFGDDVQACPFMP